MIIIEKKKNEKLERYARQNPFLFLLRKFFVEEIKNFINKDMKKEMDVSFVSFIRIRYKI